MRFQSLLMAIAVLIAADITPTQSTSTNVFDIWPGSADATSRSGLAGSSLGDVLLEVRGYSYHRAAPSGLDHDAFSNVGDVNTHAPGLGGSGRGTVHGFGGTFQDMNGSTTESFDFVIVAEGTSTGIPALPPSVLLRTASLSSPPPGSSQPVAWDANIQLSVPQSVVPNSATWFFGAGLSPNQSWSNDGLSVQMASFHGLGTPFPNSGDNPLDPGGPETVTWVRDLTNGTVRTSPSARTHDLRIFTEAPILHWGADIVAPARIGPNPNFGMAGVHPDACGVGSASRVGAYPGYTGRAGTGDGLAYRVRAGQAVGSSGFLLVSTILNRFGSPIYVNNPGFRGPLSLDPQLIVNAGPTPPIPPGGELEVSLAGLGALCPFVGDALSGQVFLHTPSANWFTNGARVIL